MNTGTTGALKLFLLCGALAAYLDFLGTAASAAQKVEQEEVVASLAAGRVVIYVAKDGMVIGAAGQHAEAGSRPPVVLPLGERRIGILLGAVEWLSPASGRPPVRLDREMPRLVSEAVPRQRQPTSEQASDLESIGVALLERVRAVASQLHHKLNLRPDEPLLELLLVNYLDDYGPEVWLLRYGVAQEALRGDYWRTRVLRPSYTQLYPPEKGQPRTLIEVQHPTADAKPTLLELLNQNDPHLARLRTADPSMSQAVERLVQGESNKAPVNDAAEFLRAALPAVSGPETKLVLGILREERGLEWVVAPPEPLPTAEEGKPREPGAPTLRKKPPQ